MDDDIVDVFSEILSEVEPRGCRVGELSKIVEDMPR